MIFPYIQKWVSNQLRAPAMRGGFRGYFRFIIADYILRSSFHSTAIFANEFSVCPNIMLTVYSSGSEQQTESYTEGVDMWGLKTSRHISFQYSVLFQIVTAQKSWLVIFQDDLQSSTGKVHDHRL
jgi:hypothetical protein